MAPQGFMTASAPGSHCGSRRGSNAGIFIEPEQNPESYGRIFLIERSHSVAVYEPNKGTFLKIKVLGLGAVQKLCRLKIRDF